MSLLEKLDKELERLDEATDIPISEIPPDKMGLLKHLGIKDSNIEDAWHGIHGHIVGIKGLGNRGFRIHKKDFNKLLKHKAVRWIEVGTIGF